ncbi:MAG: very short patch repair endonuclease [Pedobacter sp.]
MAKRASIEYIRDGRAPVPKSSITSRVMSANKGKATRPELLVRKALLAAGVKGYRLNWKTVPGRPDIAFPGKKKAIFINGFFWHSCINCALTLPKTNTEFWRTKFDRNKLRDRKKIEELQALRWEVLVIWECEIKDNLDGVVERVKNKFLNS